MSSAVSPDSFLQRLAQDGGVEGCKLTRSYVNTKITSNC